MDFKEQIVQAVLMGQKAYDQRKPEIMDVVRRTIASNMHRTNPATTDQQIDDVCAMRTNGADQLVGELKASLSGAVSEADVKRALAEHSQRVTARYTEPEPENPDVRNYIMRTPSQLAGEFISEFQKSLGIRLG